MTGAADRQMQELHTERTDLPNWHTKVACTCGFESVSRSEQWKHAAEELRAELGRFARADGYIVTGPNGVIEGFEVYVRLPEKEWLPRDKTQDPKVCPKCKSPYWNTPRRVVPDPPRKRTKR